MSKHLLPVPVFNDADLSHSFKQNTSDSFRSRQRPPKLYPKHYLDVSCNKSLTPSSIATEISFRNGQEQLCSIQQSPQYQHNHHETYFDQCFEVISRLGEGSFSEVFKVRSREDGRLYAVKKSKQPYKSEKYREERIEEVRRYEQLSAHEHCMRLFYAWEQDHHLYMQLELCQESLESFVLKSKSITEEMVWNILVDLLLALKALHDRNLIHLDVKLENILITEDHVCKLGDFGLVVDLNKPNLHQSCEGDSRYIAPELMQSHFTKAADIFSVGITALELVCNLDLPKNGPLWVQLRNGTLPTCLELVSPEMQTLIRSTMNPAFGSRPDVNTLLSLPKIQDIITKRKKLKPIRRMVHDYSRSVARFVNHSLRFVRRQIVWLAVIVMSAFSLRDVKPSPHTPVRSNIVIHPTTPQVGHLPQHQHDPHFLHPNHNESHLLLLDDSEIESSPQSKSPTIGIANSTPLTAHMGGFKNKSRRELSMQLSHSPGFFDTSDSFNYVCGASPKSSFDLSPKMCSKRKKLFCDQSEESD